MLIFGTIIAINGHKVKLKLPQYDDFETDWFFVPQMCTVEDKSSNVLEVGTLVGAVTDEEFSDGCIIGALYNDSDVCVEDDKNIKSINFSDGSVILYDKQTHEFMLDIKGNATIKAQEGLTLDCDVNVTGNITCDRDVSDKTGTMQAMREVYNGHTHICTSPQTPSQAPEQQM